jgi:hypothetical protein
MRKAILLLVTLAACGDSGSGDDDGDDAPTTRTTADDCPDRAPASDDLADRLAAAPCVASVEEIAAENPGTRAFDIRITQLVDHQDASSGTFEQQMTLIAHDETAPMVLLSTGYANYYGQNISELTEMLGANQVVVEHRYFNISRPDAADWTQLTIANAADDHHQIVRALRPIFGAAWISTGASKGGMTSVYHRRFWPDDVDGTVPYVAPINLGNPDTRYDAFLDTVGDATCRQALLDMQVELLANRRAMLESRASQQATADGLSFTRVTIPAAVEVAVLELPWSFWQYFGARYCDAIPTDAAGETDADLWDLLDAVSSPTNSDDDTIAFYEPYYYQTAYEIGYPGLADEHLEGLTLFGDEDYAGIYPTGTPVPTYRPEAMEDIDEWVQADGEGLLFVYGQWDPWTGGAFELGDARDSAIFIAPGENHGAKLRDLDPGDLDAALGMLEAWTGVTPQLPQLRSQPASEWRPLPRPR